VTYGPHGADRSDFATDAPTDVPTVTRGGP